MKKLFPFLFILLTLAACSNKPAPKILTDLDQTNKIFKEFIAVSQSKPLEKECVFQLKQTDSSKQPKLQQTSAYVCNIDLNDNEILTFVVSDASQLKAEVDPALKDQPELIYIAQLFIAKENPRILNGKKNLYNVEKKVIVTTKEIN